MFEPHTSRLTAICEAAAQLGARAVVLTDRSAIAADDGDVAVVAVDTQWADTTLELVRALASRAIPVLAHADGASRWPVATRCLSLLAGARHLLDCESAGFHEELRARLGQILDVGRVRGEEAQRVADTMADVGFVGRSPAIVAVLRVVLRVGPLSDVPVVVLGETGTGKELIARAIHRLDPKRSRAAFVPVNCAALTRSIAESELFGHRRGSFTGADRDRPGLVRAASGGVLFLDEVGELEPELQGKLLRVLQEGRVLGVGHDHEVPVDVRVIAATHRDLAEQMRQGRFREDLYHRLTVIPLHLPPLRERPEDVSPLVEHLLEKHRALAPAVLAATPAFVDAISMLGLPGNVRELENLVRRAMAQKEDGSELDLADLPREALLQLTRAAVPERSSADDGALRHASAERFEALLGILHANGWKLSPALRAVERAFIVAALDRMKGNQSETARLLGLSARSVYTKLRRHQILARSRATESRPGRT